MHSAFLNAAKSEHESQRIDSEAYLFAWSLGFDVMRCKAALAETKALFASRDMKPSEERDLEISRRAVAIAVSRTEKEAA